MSPQEKGVYPANRFSPSQPCPVCGGHPQIPQGRGERCHGFFSEDGEWAHCTREEHAGDLPQHPNSGTFSHKLVGNCRCGTRHDSNVPIGHTPQDRYRDKGNMRRNQPSKTASRPYITWREPNASYEIRTASGELKAIHERFDHEDGSKRFFWKQPNGESGLGGARTRDLPLYRSELISSWPTGAEVVLVEGESATDALHKVGIRALGTVTGANSNPAPEALEVLRGFRVTLWPDGDSAGFKHMERNAESLAGIAAEVRWYEWKGAPDGIKGPDAADHPATKSGDSDAIRGLKRELAESPLWEANEGTPVFRRTFTAAELLNMDLPPIRWAVPDIVPEGVTLLAGKPKLGKSWLALGLCIATASGGVALGIKRVEKGSCLYLALEDNKRRMKTRLAKLLEGGAPEGLHIALEWPRLDDGGVEELEVWLKSNPDARLVIIDTLAKIRPLKRGQNVYAEDYAALEPLLPLAARYSVAIVVVHHLRQMPAADPLDEISGSTGLTGGVDGALVLKRNRGQADAYLHVTGRDIEEEAELALRWDQHVAGWTLVGNADDYRMSQERRDALDVLEEAGEPLGPKEVADKLGKSDEKGYAAVRQLFSQMNKEGLIKSVTYGKYVPAHSPHSAHTSLNQANLEAESVSGYPKDTHTVGAVNPISGSSVSGVSGVIRNGHGPGEERRQDIDHALKEMLTEEKV